MKLSRAEDGSYLLQSEQRIRRSLEEVFDFFSDAQNLEALTPPWLNFQVLESSTHSVGEGTTIDYKLRLRGLPLRWRSLISAWNPPREFVDEQVRGPYKSWHHRHTFVPTEDGVLVGDRVRYRVHGGALVHSLFVKHDLKRIFQFRAEALAHLLPDQTTALHA